MKKQLFALLFCTAFLMSAQSPDEDYPFLSRTYVQFNLGALFNDFDGDVLEPGFTAGGTSANPFSGRILFGYKITEDLAIQYGVIRPAAWFEFNDVQGTDLSKTVWTNAWSLTARKDFKLSSNWSLFAEAGPVNVTRVGFELGENTVVRDKQYLSILTASGVSYKLNDQWSLMAHAVYIPKDTDNQPAIQQYNLGVQYNLSDLAPADETGVENGGNFFPVNTLQIGYGNDFIGYAPNKILSMNARVAGTRGLGIPIFWYGDAKASNTILVNYTRDVYRSRKFFSLGFGVSATAFESSLDKEWIGAFSIYPQVRFFFWRAAGFDAYATYSVIGPTFITKEDIDGLDTGPRITYQDFVAAGAYLGKDRKWNAELKIIHYSNGNNFTGNAGVAVPIVFQIGRRF
ncbi:acyloxyacyl hydrolase [Nonlabens ponticola]|uniref:Acyloxyacyl hydrolase n=1 Tax=Nonlabens ponticola TaxID=2496866 RepID=A0A3S9MXE8_9FLAO|nr:acyloxyacyl hydrolase [Nonlabens ponticola]AZQ43925.1 hypothetical protein EJ995_06645 [Nonlabens ponticola]